MSTRLLFAAIAALFLATTAQAASISFYMDQSNTEGAWADGVPYLQVTISDSMDHPGDIEFLVTPLGSLTDYAVDNFGIQSFGFNSSHTLTAGNIAGPGWSLGSGNMDGFGSYGAILSGTGGSRQDPLAFRITGIDGDSIHDYAIDGAGGAQGKYFFAAHVAGMSKDGASSAYFGGNTVVPVPAAVWLLGSALAGLGLIRRRAPAAG